MQYKNARWNEQGDIDCDLEHPAHGWIPFTASKNDVAPFGRLLFAEIEANLAEPEVAT